MYPIHLSSGMTSCSVFRTVLRSVLCWILLGALLPNGAQAQRMPQDTWYLAKEFRGQNENGSAEFGATHGIAVDADGNIYISDYNNHEIRKFDKAYNFVKRFGSQGSGNGQFVGPGGLAISPNNRLYAVDCDGNCVQIFDLDGKFVAKFGGAGSTDGLFNSPYQVAVSKTGTVFVTDRNNHRVQVFDANGKFLFKFGKQGSFYGEFQEPHGLAVSPEGFLAVGDAGNSRVQIFDLNGGFVRQFATPGGYSSARPERLCFLRDGLLCVQCEYQWGFSAMRLYIVSGELLKEWDCKWACIAETVSGDIVAAHGGDHVVRLWKRTYRLAQPEPGNAVPLPSILSQARRPGTSLVDVDYVVKDADDATVQTAALAFKNGGNSLADVIPITSFAEGTGVQLGTGITTGAVHRFTWDVTKDWATDFGEVQLEILAKDKRGLLNLDFIRIPADKGLPELKISRSPLNDTDFLSVWYWLIATQNPNIKLLDGRLLSAGTQSAMVQGASAEYFSNADFTGQYFQRIDDVPLLNYGWSPSGVAGIPFVPYSVRWNCEFVPTVTGNYTLDIGVDDVVTIWLDGKKVVSENNPSSYVVQTQAGVPISMRIDFDDREGGYHYFALNLYPTGTGPSDISKTQIRCDSSLASGTGTSLAGRKFLFDLMGLREATPEEVKRAKEAGTPGVINQWDPKTRRVGPDERPAKINSYGFDTGADGFWVVPVTK